MSEEIERRTQRGASHGKSDRPDRRRILHPPLDEELYSHSKRRHLGQELYVGDRAAIDITKRKTLVPFAGK